MNASLTGRIVLVPAFGWLRLTFRGRPLGLPLNIAAIIVRMPQVGPNGPTGCYFDASGPWPENLSALPGVRLFMDVFVSCGRGQHASWLGIPGPPVPTYSCHSALVRVCPAEVQATVDQIWTRNSIR